MFSFNDVIGQKEVVDHLKAEVEQGRTAHALLFTGPKGAGKLPLALALARRLCCMHPEGGEACGHCPSCRQWEKLGHPDVHFVFPIVNNKKVSDDYLPQWRNMLLENTYTDLGRWMELIEAGNTQPQIYATESDRTLRKLSLKSGQGGWRVVLVWLPERMNESCANAAHLRSPYCARGYGSCAGGAIRADGRSGSIIGSQGRRQFLEDTGADGAGR